MTSTVCSYFQFWCHSLCLTYFITVLVCCRWRSVIPLSFSSLSNLFVSCSLLCLLKCHFLFVPFIAQPSALYQSFNIQCKSVTSSHSKKKKSRAWSLNYGEKKTNNLKITLDAKGHLKVTLDVNCWLIIMKKVINCEFLLALVVCLSLKSKLNG